MSEAEDDLRATVDSITADAARLAEIERQKRDLEPGDPRLLPLSEKAHALAEGMVPKTQAELEIAAELEQPT